MFGWAMLPAHRHVDRNPVRDVAKLDHATDGYHTWTPAEVEQYERHFAIGTKARLSLAIMLLTGARRQDIVHFGRQHIRDGWLTFTPIKTSRKKHSRKQLVIPVLPELQNMIASTQTGDLTFLVTEYGRAFTAAGFGNWFRDRCREAGLNKCSAHGLRKAAATLIAERGATERQMMAIFGWSDPRQATIYTRAADQKSLAAAGMQMLRRNESETKVSSESDT